MHYFGASLVLVPGYGVLCCTRSRIYDLSSTSMT